MSTVYPNLAQLMERQRKTAPRALFLAGPPGSGKSTITKAAIQGTSAKIIDVDQLVEYFASRKGVDYKDAERTTEFYTDMGAKNRKRREYFMRTKQDICIDGTGRDANYIERMKRECEQLGYETGMLFVAVDLETALSRNHTRTRSLDTNFVETTWHEVFKNIRRFDMMFDPFFFVRNDASMDDQEASKNRNQILHKVRMWLG